MIIAHNYMSFNKKNIFEKSYQLGVPHMLSGRLSENWLMKELGDILWNMIAKGLQVPIDSIVDDDGERLYASLIRSSLISKRGEGLQSFNEGECILIKSQLTQYKTKMFFIRSIITDKKKKIELEVYSVAVLAKKTCNNKISNKKKIVIQNTVSKVPLLKSLPEEVKNHFKLKNHILISDNEVISDTHQFYGLNFKITTDAIYTCDYEIDPYDDISGIGVLYCASYSKISDKCERHFFEEKILGNQIGFNWAIHSDCLARDVHYYNSADAREQIVYQLDQAIFLDEVTVQIASSLYRKSNKEIIAKIFTVKKIKEFIRLGSTIGHKDKIESQEEKLIYSTNDAVQKIPQNSRLFSKPRLTPTALEKIITEFLESVYKDEKIQYDTDLRKLGIESITYTELSTFLNINHEINTNPSHFYGLYTVKDIVNYCLDTIEERNAPKSKNNKSEEIIGDNKDDNNNDIAIVGIACRLPGASTLQEFWENLKNNTTSIGRTPKERWNWPKEIDLKDKHRGIDHGGYLNNIDHFDSLFFEISPRDALMMDPQQRMLLQLTWELFESSGRKPSDYRKSNTGVFIGASGSDYERVVAETNPIGENTPTGNAMTMLANRISYNYDFEGPSISIDTACSSSLVAIAEAVKSLNQKDCDQAIVGGIHLMCNPAKNITYYTSNMLSKDGKCYTFDAAANGFVRGEGAVVMLLKPLKEAEKKGDKILGVLKSATINHGGYSTGVTVPNPHQQKNLIIDAYKKAKIPVETVSYIEVHGTGTKLGDPIEIRALKDAFKELQNNNSDNKWCSLGSVKTNIGHLEAASGIVGLLKVLLSIQQKYLPATLNFKELNPHIELENSPFKIQKDGTIWESSVSELLRAGVSSFGLGGTNAHVVIEEYQSKLEEKETVQLPVNIFTLSALNENRLQVYTKKMYDWIKAHRNINLTSLAYTLQTTKEEFAQRLAFTYRNYTDLINKLEKYLTKEEDYLLYTENIKEHSRNHNASSFEQYIQNQDFDALAAFWSKGGEVVWENLYRQNKIQLLPLPTYPFLKKRFWIGKKIQEERLLNANSSLEVQEATEEIVKKQKKDTVVTEKPQNVSFGNKVILTPVNEISSPSSENKKDVIEKIKLQPIISYPVEATISKEEVIKPIIVSNKEIEEKLIALLCETLYLSPEELDTDQNFSELGLDSILGVELAKKISKQWGVNFSTVQLYNYPTIKELGSYIKSNYQSSLMNEAKIPASIIANISSFQEEKEELKSFFKPVKIIGDIGADQEVIVEYQLSLENTPCLKDHRVFNEYVLPTDAYVELIYAFFKEHTGKNSLVLRKLHISNNLTAIEGEKYSVVLNLKKIGEKTIRFTISHKELNKIYIRGFIVSKAPLIDHNLIDKHINQEIQLRADELTDWTKDILSGSYFNIRKSLEIEKEFMKGVIALSTPENKPITYIAQWLDNILVSSIQYAAIHQQEGKVDDVMYLPYRIGEIIVHTAAQPNLDYNCSIICHESDAEKFLFSIQATHGTSKLFTIQNLELRRIYKEQLFPQKKTVTTLNSEKNTGKLSKSNQNDVAIIGMSCRFPGAENVDEFWENLKKGVDSIQEINAEQWNEKNWYNQDPRHKNTSYSKWGGFIKDSDKFDSLFFGISPHEAELMDPQQRVFLEECWKTLEDANYTSKTLDKKNVGVFVGAGAGDYQHLLTQSRAIKDGYSFMGNSQAILSARIAFLLNLKGPALTIDTACSSALVAIDRAYQSILSGETDMALAGGVKLMCSPLLHVWISQVGMASKNGKCKTFDNEADGIVSSEGVGVILLKRLDEAIKDGDKIHAVIKGSGINQDGRTNGITAPSGTAQSILQQRVYKQYDINPETIGYVEAHGTGTKLGDPIEVEALKISFKAKSSSTNKCALGSVKSNIGHAGEAAGISSFIKTVLMLKNKYLVPSLHFHQLNEEITLEESPFYINTISKPWERNIYYPRRAAINSFGFSGTNAHIVLEEYQNSDEKRLPESNVEELILLSAKTDYSLKSQVFQIMNYLITSKEALRDIAYTLQVGRDYMKERLAVVGTSKKDIIDQLNRFLNTIESNVLRGTVEKRIKKARNNSQEEIEAAILEKNYKTLSQAWIDGENIDWTALYPKKTIKKVQLPTYVFEKERYWIDLKETEKQQSTQEKLHPLVHRNASTLDKQLYESTFHGTEMVYKDHIVDGNKVLAGVGYIELASVALKEALKKRIWGIKDIFWQKLLIVNDQKKVFVEIKPNSEKIEYQIFTEENKGRLIHGTGKAILNEPERPKQINLQELQKKLYKTTSKEDFYLLTEKKGFNLGDSFQGIQEHGSADEFALSKIHLPLKEGFKMYPGALDSALQNALGWLMIEGIVEKAFPFSIKTCYQFVEELPETFWSYTRKSKSIKKTEKVQEYDIDILDEKGNVLMQLLQCVFLSSPNDKQAKKATTAIEKIEWQEVPYAKNKEVFYEDTILYLIGGSPILADTLKDLYEAEVKLITSENEIDTYIQIFEDIKPKLQTKTKTQLIILGLNEEYEQYGFISGMLKTLSLEHPNFEGKIIAAEDLAVNSTHEILEILNREQLNTATEVKYIANKRHEKMHIPFSFSEIQEKPFKNSGVYVLVGGTGGIGNIISKHILNTPDAKVILIGKNRSVDKSLSKNEYHYQCDITDAQVIKNVFEEIRGKFKEINGILYLVGVTADKYIKEKTKEDLKKVLKVKIEGVKNIDQATKTDSLDFMIFFSSIAAIHGNVGQIDYAAANAFLDNYSYYRESERVKGNRFGITKSINWALWENGGMQIDSGIERYLQKKWNMSAMPDQEGIRSFEQILNSDSIQASVIYQGSPKNTTINLENKNTIPKTRFLEKLKSLAASLVKMDPNKIKVHVELGDYGFDSILYTHFCNEINDLFKLDVNPTLFFNYPTLEEVATHLEENYTIEIAGEKKVIPVIDDQKKQEPITNYPSKKHEEKQVAVVGISGRFPDAKNIDELWKHLENEDDLITEVPKSRWDWKKYYGNPQEKNNTTLCKWGGFLDGVDEFDPLFFNISPVEAELMDPQQRLVLQEVYHALEDAAISIDDIKGSDTGVFIGVSSSDYNSLLKSQTNQAGMAQFATGSAHSVLVNRISYIFDLHGASEPIDTACSSSLIAIHHAAEYIKNGHAKTAIAGGVNVILSPELTLSFSQAGMLSNDGRCKTFDQSANGYVRGEGVGILVLKDLDQAIIDKNPIYGILKGGAENHGGKANTLTSPNPKAQKELLVKAYKSVKINPKAVSYIEAHGTGTKLGDPIEIEGLKLAFEELYKGQEESYTQNKHCAIGSIKTNVGHLEAAAGVAGVIKVLMAIQNNKIPGNPMLHQPNSYLKLDGTPFYLQRETTDWNTEGHHKIAGVSSFGFGGANAHVIVEEYVKNKVKEYVKVIPILVLSAKDSNALKNLAKELNLYLVTNEETSFEEVVYTLQAGRAVMEYRLAMVVNDRKECIRLLDEFVKNNQRTTPIYMNNARESTLDEDSTVITQLFREGDIHSIAKLWSQGVIVDWKSLYGNKYPRKVNLPTYPFKKDRYWFTPKEKVEAETSFEENVHPLVQSVVNNTTFKSQFSGKEAVFSSHKVNGISVLPGAAQIEWIREIGSRYKGKPVTRLTNIAFREPIQEINNKEVEVFIELEEDTEGVNYKFLRKSENVLYSNGKIKYDPLPATNESSIVIENIMLRLPNHLSKEKYYELLDEKGIFYGSHFRGIQKIIYSKTEVLAEVVLPVTNESYMLSPFLLDSAIQTVMGLSLEFDRKNATKLPFYIEEVKIYKELSQQFWSYAKKIDPINEQALPTYDVDLINEEGEVLVQFTGFVALDITAPSEKQELNSIDNLMYLLKWERKKLPIHSSDYTGNVLIISSHNTSKISNQLRNYLIGKNAIVMNSNEISEILDGFTDLYFICDSFQEYYLSKSEMLWKENELNVFQQLKKLLASPYAQKELNITVLSDRTQKVLDTDKLQYHGSGIVGLMSSLAKEQSNWNVRIIDIDASECSNHDIVQILSIPYDSNGEVVAYRNKSTYVKEFYPLEKQKEQAPASKLKKKGVYIILGGSGGIGEVTTIHLVKEYQAQVIWLGRSPKNDRITEAQKKIAQWGLMPEYIQCDGTLKQDVEAAYKQIKENYTTINGIFHSALVLKDALLHDMDEKSFTTVFESKANSSHHLIEVFSKESLDFVCFYSSIQSQVNALGQANYAAACMYKDSYALSIKQKFNIPIHIINWGYWGSVGVVASDKYRSKMEKIGVGSIESDEGMAILEEIISHEYDQVIAAKFL